MLNVTITVRPEDLEGPASGLVSFFQQAMEQHTGIRPAVFPGEGRSFMHIQFRDKEGKPWGANHDMQVCTEDVTEHKRYVIIARALDLLERQRRLVGIDVPRSEIRSVSCWFMYWPNTSEQ